MFDRGRVADAIVLTAILLLVLARPVLAPPISHHGEARSERRADAGGPVAADPAVSCSATQRPAGSVATRTAPRGKSPGAPPSRDRKMLGAISTAVH
jgi:hypothetical protein